MQCRADQVGTCPDGDISWSDRTDSVSVCPWWSHKCCSWDRETPDWHPSSDSAGRISTSHNVNISTIHWLPHSMDNSCVVLAQRHLVISHTLLSFYLLTCLLTYLALNNRLRNMECSMSSWRADWEETFTGHIRTAWLHNTQPTVRPLHAVHSFTGS